MAFGHNVKRIRELKGISKAEVRRRTGGVVSEQALGQLERRDGKKSEFAVLIAEALEVPVQELFGDLIVPSIEDTNTVLVEEHDIAFSGGNGRNGQPESAIKALRAYDADWLSQEGLKPEKLRRFTVEGDSMEPLLFDGDAILVNLNETNIVDGKVYAFRYGDDLKVKRLVKQLDGSLVLKSQNEDYRDEIISADQVEQKVQIIGRVRDKSGKGGL